MTKQKNCPICGGKAVLGDKLWDGQKYDCPDCGVFRVGGAAEKALAQSSSEDRAAKLAEAKRNAKPGLLPFIHGE